MIRRAYEAFYNWLAVEIEVGGKTWYGTDAFGVGVWIGAMVALGIVAWL